ncbi:hypothetical protein TPHA_0K00940 [Tetrapisispora phaffii CBS 4417]|uniref:Polyprenal reductase n=1 Tax=Tetrapisispora phaffii (strain ATCC 24235 / CBS 4417 / NBRC 1672 / NRRL Y-8282 / UCD 70-5) TaxID=1071381 RepID=G8BZA0_TETPH|nr:hypothetical protein TPHA_0K00940 [Tetrapisispora phaffii CBS 4417]CCE65228.1 hypothetical protein TPHA_0K00940 [Tetrapisispora phaffii CBS 4417]
MVNLINFTIIGYRSSFIFGLFSLVIAKWFLPEFLKYGKTLTTRDSSNDIKKVFEDNGTKNLLERIQNTTVPKQWFFHFYLLSTIFTLITLYKNYQHKIIWIILIHSLRRLYETLYVSKYTSESRMNWSHYVVGLWFYSVLHIILYIQILQGNIDTHLNYYSVLLFTMASWDQHKNHTILSELVKYSLPKGRLFSICSSPHYLDEILIYMSFLPFNREFSWLVVWIIASLTISAIETHNYYKSKFKDQTIPKYSIIPFII